MTEWIAETDFQFGDPEDRPWEHLEVFLRGFIAGLADAGASEPELLAARDEDGLYGNPTRRVGFRLVAPDEQEARRLAEQSFFRAGLESGVTAVPPEARQFGWMATTTVRPA